MELWQRLPLPGMLFLCTADSCKVIGGGHRLFLEALNAIAAEHQGGSNDSVIDQTQAQATATIAPLCRSTPMIIVYVTYSDNQYP